MKDSYFFWIDDWPTVWCNIIKIILSHKTLSQKLHSPQDTSFRLYILGITYHLSEKKLVKPAQLELLQRKSKKINKKSSCLKNMFSLLFLNNIWQTVEYCLLRNMGCFCSELYYICWKPNKHGIPSMLPRFSISLCSSWPNSLHSSALRTVFLNNQYYVNAAEGRKVG